MSLKTDAAILAMLPELTPVEFTLLMALSQVASGNVIKAPNYALAVIRVGLTERQAGRTLGGLALHGLAHLQPPTADRPGIFRVRGGDEE